MPDLLLAAIGYGGYISIIKCLIFLGFFFGWLPLLMWVYQDARAIETKAVFWAGIVLGAGAAGTIIWLAIPVFIAGMLLYLIVVGATSYKGDYIRWWENVDGSGINWDDHDVASDFNGARSVFASDVDGDGDIDVDDKVFLGLRNNPWYITFRNSLGVVQRFTNPVNVEERVVNFVNVDDTLCKHAIFWSMPPWPPTFLASSPTF